MDVHVTRERNAVHDRLVIYTGTRRLGYYDMRAGEPLPTWPQERHIVDIAYRYWCKVDPHVTAQLSFSLDEAFYDLSNNHAGDNLRNVRGASFRKGVVGESRTARILDGLYGWHAIHSIPLSLGDIDHLAIGPPGVFVLDSKNRSGHTIQQTPRGAIKVDDHYEPYIKKLDYMAARVSLVLSADPDDPIEVHSLLVAWADQCIDGPRLVAGERLAERLFSLAPVYNPLVVQALYAKASNADTWIGQLQTNKVPGMKAPRTYKPPFKKRRKKKPAAPPSK